MTQYKNPLTLDFLLSDIIWGAMAGKVNFNFENSEIFQDLNNEMINLTSLFSSELIEQSFLPFGFCPMWFPCFLFSNCVLWLCSTFNLNQSLLVQASELLIVFHIISCMSIMDHIENCYLLWYFIVTGQVCMPFHITFSFNHLSQKIQYVDHDGVC